jgi:GrpB-like predicted nucleotidyltransferase (UPF0157 family)
MLGLNKGEVKLVSYSFDWKNLFEKEKKLLNSIIGELVVDIQHFGSTSITGIDTKPIIDILVGAKSLNDVEEFDQERLKGEGYYQLPKVVIKGKKVFAKFSNLETLTKTHILHVVEHKGEWWSQHIFFRDFLNKDDDARRKYENLKRKLAKKYPEDEKSYSDEKKKFVDSILSNKK